MVTGSPVMVACVVNNLLLNAVNFTQEGGIDVKLTPGELTVRDTGIGIPPKDLSRIFERRYRGAQSRGLGTGAIPGEPHLPAPGMDHRDP
jgi:signal transduction histidine kinase